MSRRQYAGGAAQTTLTGSVASSGAVTITISASTGWPDGSVGPFAVVVDPGTASEEKILVTSRSGTNLTVGSPGRGYDGTSATAHSSGAVIYPTVTAVDLDEANAHVNLTAAAHAATAISNTPAGNIAATTVQAALNELDTEKASTSHTQASSTITDFTEAVQDVVGAMFTAGTSLTVTYDDTAGTETVGVTAGGIGTTQLAALSVTDAKMELAPTSRWSRNASQTITATTEAAVVWQVEDEDDLGLAAVNVTTVTMPADSQGIYSIDATINFASAPGASGYIQFKITRSAQVILYRVPAINSNIIQGVTFTPRLEVGDVWEIDVYNSAGSSISLGTQASRLAVTKLRSC